MLTEGTVASGCDTFVTAQEWKRLQARPAAPATRALTAPEPGPG
ncbi:hypothetical protein HMPREF1318_2196, partial [Actinomyces massiliensis F0489]